MSGRGRAINKDQIGVVTGEPRSGTSLVMQVLDALGIRVAGEKYPIDARQQRQKNDAAVAHAKELNPLGFWEVPGVVMRGLADIGEYGAQVVKIMAPGLMRTPEPMIGRGVLCLRDPRHVAQSQTRLQANVNILGAAGWEPPIWKINATRYVLEMGAFAGWWAARDAEYRSRFVTVDYDKHVDEGQGTADVLAANFGVGKKPVAVVNASLRRSPESFVAWPREMAETGAIAERIYRGLLAGDMLECAACGVLADAVRDAESRERTIIYDDRLVSNITVAGLRQIERNPKLLARLKASRGERLRRGMGYACCPEFGGESAKTYTRKLPLDMGGDTAAKLVIYQGIEMTPEQAQARHEARLSERK